MEIKRLFDILPYYETSFKPKEDVLAGKENGEWVNMILKPFANWPTVLATGY